MSSNKTELEVFIAKVEEGLKQLKKGETTSHTEVKKMVEKLKQKL